MKRLYIIRHGKSDWKAGIKNDFDRTLNERGMQDAPRMGKFLSSNFETPELIISSPAIRALTTARLVAHEVNYSLSKIKQEPSIYEAPLQNLLNVVNKLPNEIDIVYLFGHNPGLSMLTYYLTDEYVDMKTCNVSVLSAEIDDWQMLIKGICTLDAFLSPKSI